MVQGFSRKYGDADVCLPVIDRRGVCGVSSHLDHDVSGGGGYRHDRRKMFLVLYRYTRGSHPAIGGRVFDPLCLTKVPL